MDRKRHKAKIINLFPAYEDDLIGISSAPRNARRNEEGLHLLQADTTPPDVSKEALALCDEAARAGAWETLQGHFSELEPLFPYEKHMKDIGIEELNLSVRSSITLLRARVDTFGRLYCRITSEGGLFSIRNMGARSEKEIKEVFFSECYKRLHIDEKPIYWQRMIDQAHEKES